MVNKPLYLCIGRCSWADSWTSLYSCHLKGWFCSNITVMLFLVLCGFCFTLSTILPCLFTASVVALAMGHIQKFLKRFNVHTASRGSNFSGDSPSCSPCYCGEAPILHILVNQFPFLLCSICHQVLPLLPLQKCLVTALLSLGPLSKVLDPCSSNSQSLLLQLSPFRSSITQFRPNPVQNLCCQTHLPLLPFRPRDSFPHLS